MDTAKLAIIMALGIPLAAVVGGILLAMLKIVAGGGASRKKRELDVEEARLLQDLHEGLERMEERVETLETLLLDRETDVGDSTRPADDRADGKRGGHD